MNNEENREVVGIAGYMPYPQSVPIGKFDLDQADPAMKIDMSFSDGYWSVNNVDINMNEPQSIKDFNLTYTTDDFNVQVVRRGMDKKEWIKFSCGREVGSDTHKMTTEEVIGELKKAIAILRNENGKSL